ncbi:hypothetical protein R3P38DRAFT_3422790 [Favolaschia claudopus]|uniref:Transmembrane protein n=1 Tax=Favolaschia claudopus TaxID=2862362 RepID=A0AAW0D7E2_9AGAR
MNGTPNDSQNELQLTFEGPGQTLSVYNSLQLNGTDFEFHYGQINWTSTVSSSKPEETFHSKASLFHFDGEWDIDDKGSSTSKVGASVNFTFQGDHVALYGVTGQGTNYTAQLDSGAVVQLGQVFDFTSVGVPPANQLLFFSNGLSSEEHILTLNANAISPLFPFTVNYATVDGDLNNPQNDPPTSTSLPAIPGASTPSLNGTHPGFHGPFPHSGNQDHHGLTQTQIIGLVVGITASGTLLLIALAYILCMRHRRNKTKKKQSSPKSFYDLTPSPPPPAPTQPLYHAPAHTAFATSSAPVLPMPTNASDDPNIQIYDFERPGVDRSHSYYSQSSMTLDGSGEIHQTDAYGRYKIQSIARDSEGYFVKGKTTYEGSVSGFVDYADIGGFRQRYTAENLGGTQGGGEGGLQGGLGYAI